MKLWKHDPATGIDYLGGLTQDDAEDSVLYYPPSCQGTRATGSNITSGPLPLPPANAWVMVPLPIRTYCEFGSSDIPNYVYTCPLDGRFDIIAFCQITTPGGWVAADVELGLFINGVFFTTLDIDHLHAAGTAPARPQLALDGNDMLQLVEATTIELGVRQNNAAPQVIAAWSARFAIHWNDNSACGECVP